MNSKSAVVVSYFVSSYRTTLPSFILSTLLQGVPLVLIVLSGGPPSSDMKKLREISTSLKNNVNIWTIGSGPSASSDYLKEIASKEEQSHWAIFFEKLSPLVSEITGKLCSGKVNEIFFRSIRFLVGQRKKKKRKGFSYGSDV